MGLYNLDKIFNPKSVAVIGAGEKPGTVGNALISNLIAGKFQGNLFPVNPKYETVHGLPAYSAISKIPEPVDLAIIATPIQTLEAVVDACIDAQIGGAVILSAGGKEIGDAGRQIEVKIIEKAYQGGLRIVGPNCLGIICAKSRLNASFAPRMPQIGNLAFVSQSGAICTAILDLAAAENIGFSHFVSVGSMLDVDFGDLIDYLGNDGCVTSILLYMESLTHIRKFMSAARSVSRVKPILVLKSGRSAAGARAATSHTGAMAGEDAVYDAAFNRAGIVRVDTIQDLFDCAELIAKQRRPAGNRLAIITNGGGPGVMAADCLSLHGVEPAPLDSETREMLNTFMPPFWSRNNPIDILGDASAERYNQTIDACMTSSGFDAALVIFAPQALTDPLQVAQELVVSLKSKKFPIYVTWMGGRSVAPAIALMNQNGIPTYDTPERAVRSFLYMHDYAIKHDRLQIIPPALTTSIRVDRKRARVLLENGIQREVAFLSEIESKEILDSYGIPTTRTVAATSMKEAVKKSDKIGYPVVMKLVSPDITHKTEANGVQLDISSPEEVERAYVRIMNGAMVYNPDARIEGVSIQPYIARPDYELLIGAKRDESFGPVVLFGMGGIFTEVMKDRALALPPLNRVLANQLMMETKAYSLLKGYRNRPPADMERLESLLIRLSQLLIDCPEIMELDMNPVIVKNGKPHAVDARIAVKTYRVPSPHHLIISPYPQQQEHREITEEGAVIFIRPVKPEDAPLFVDFSKTLSETSIYYRFFSVIRKWPRDMLIRFTQIDYDREIALVALEESGEIEKMLGVARVYIKPDGKEGECAVIVGDPWHGMGIGSRLLFRCLVIAKQRGLKHVTGLVLKNNRNMLGMVRKLGFEVDRGMAGEACEIKIDLDRFIGDACCQGEA